MNSEQALWQYFREVRAAVDAANDGDANQPYEIGQFMIVAQAGEIELAVSNISEEDAILIASELRAGGVTVNVRDTVTCSHCGKRVPKQAFCSHCRGKLNS